MNHAVFTDGHVRVIGFRGAVPYKIGLYSAVYLSALEGKEFYAIGDDLERQRHWPCRSPKRIQELVRKDVITRHRDMIRVDERVVVLCITEETDAALQDVLPDWRASYIPIQVWHQPAVALLLLPEEAEELALTTVIALQTVIDDCVLDHSSEDSAQLGEALGWIAWGLLSRQHHRARQDTMIRIVAARFRQKQRGDKLRLVACAAKSLGEPNAAAVVDLARAYLRNGRTYAST